MDKEQFDHIELLFQQAAMNVSPSADDEAWKKMEVLLDREFRKKRRRTIIWWWPVILFFLLLGSGTMFYYYNYLQPANNKNGINRISPLISPVDKPQNYNEEPGLQQRNQRQDKPVTSDRNFFTHPQQQSKPSAIVKQSGQDAEKHTIAKNIQPIHAGKGTVRKATKTSAGVSDLFPVRDRQALNTVYVPVTKNKRRENPLKGKITLPDLASDSGIQNGPIKYMDPFLSKVLLTDTSLLNLGTMGSNTSIQLKKVSRFYFVAAIAPDASAVGKLQLNKFNSRLGIGAGYQLSKKFSLQTGIYAGRMIYTAGDGDYTIKPSSYISKIIKINADCYFYNVPLSLRYNALQFKNYNLYAVGGLSSFWSKKETYDYHFLNGSGMYRSMVSTYKNNKNLFSTIHLSMGVERNLSKVLYLQAEPYLLVPLSGIGEGKVKLRSAGLQVGIMYKPLRK